MSVRVTPVLKDQDPQLLHRRDLEPDAEGRYMVDYGPGLFSESEIVTIIDFEVETSTGKRRLGLEAGIRVGPGDTLRHVFKLGNL